MHPPNIAHVVYRHLFPRPKQNDPSSFSGHVTRNLVPEVRIETATFYGALDCIEAQYPGLDYTHSPHRRRLSRFPWHRRLFRAFDELGLTSSEILSICQWEGTKSAKQKYERDAGQEIRDTTADGVSIESRPHSPRAIFAAPERPAAPHLEIISDVMRHHGNMYTADDDSVDERSDLDESIDFSRISSYGVELNRRLLAAAEARMRGDPATVFDEQWEQWLKEAMERHAMLPPHLQEQVRERIAADTRGLNLGRVGSTARAFDNNNLAAAAVSGQPSIIDEEILNRSSGMAVDVNAGPHPSTSAAGAA